MFPIIQIPDESPIQAEQLGTKLKAWYQDGDGNLVLFKIGRAGTGENWAEKVASEICEALVLPHARYDFATWKGMKGVVSPSFVPADSRLVLGNELLIRYIKGYAADRFYRQTNHTVTSVIAIMRVHTIGLPDGYIAGDAAITLAADLFVGYLMLDALIGNTDRHHENWALVSKPGRVVKLAPTYDHASSLGRNESDGARQDRLHTRDRNRSVAAYAEKARSAFFKSPSDTRPLSTLDAFVEAARLQPPAARYWLDRLATVEPGVLNRILDQVPRSEISEVAVQFAKEFLVVNRNRLLKLRGSR